MPALLRKLGCACLLAGIAANAHAGWTLNNDESTLDFVSIKKSEAGEVNSFERLEGSLDDSGEARVVISLDSVETNIPIRNDRMKSMLFEVEDFPESSVSTTVDLDRLNDLAVGETFAQPVELRLAIHGEEKAFEADMRVVKLADDRLLISTVKPVIVNATDFALGAGVEKLREVAGLPSISTAVPVTASLLFEPQAE